MPIEKSFPGKSNTSQSSAANTSLRPTEVVNVKGREEAGVEYKDNGAQKVTGKTDQGQDTEEPSRRHGKVRTGRPPQRLVLKQARGDMTEG